MVLLWMKPLAQKQYIANKMQTTTQYHTLYDKYENWQRDAFFTDLHVVSVQTSSHLQSPKHRHSRDQAGGDIRPVKDTQRGMTIRSQLWYTSSSDFHSDKGRGKRKQDCAGGVSLLISMQWGISQFDSWLKEIPSFIEIHWTLFICAGLNVKSLCFSASKVW